jgi:hypothetical protein
MKYLDLPVLRDDDKYLMIIEEEWEAIYEDTARLYSRKADSSHDRMRILEDVVRFRATPGYYRRKTLGNLRPTPRSRPPRNSDAHSGTATIQSWTSDRPPSDYTVTNY